MKISELLEKNVYAEDLNVGKITDIVVDMEELKITHFELELSKEASEQVLGVTPGLLKPAKNILAVSAIEKGQLAVMIKVLDFGNLERATCNLSKDTTVEIFPDIEKAFRKFLALRTYALFA